MEQDVTDKFFGHEGRLTALESRVGVLETGAVKLESTMLELTKKVDSLTASQQLQLEILQRLDAVFANPSIKIILAVVALALTTWATSRGLK